jgi:hypothetical protein
MQKLSIACAVAVTLTLVAPVSAQESVVLASAATHATTVYQPQESFGQRVLSPVVIWLATNFDLPANHDHPSIERASVEKLMMLRDGGQLSQTQSALMRVDSDASKRLPIAAYDDATKTIYLPANWFADTPEGRSALIHAMVYHLQNLAGIKHKCPQERARVAYDAQTRWLHLSERTLEDAFGVDGETLLFATECYIP